MNSLSTVQIALLTIKKCALLKILKTNVIPIYVDMKKYIVEIFVDLKSLRLNFGEILRDDLLFFISQIVVVFMFSFYI